MDLVYHSQFIEFSQYTIKILKGDFIYEPYNYYGSNQPNRIHEGW